MYITSTLSNNKGGTHKSIQQMEVERLLHMNGGLGKTSYATNSSLQKGVMCKAKPILVESIKELLYTINFPDCLKIADLGCSSGPNTLLLVYDIMDSIHVTCQQLKLKEPIFQVFLNDLPANDFNTIFWLLPSFYEKVKNEKGSDFGPCFVSALPGTFYGRLFPNQFLHFVHSSYCHHWLSEVPKGLVSEAGTPLNKGNVHVGRTSPRNVLKVYQDFFQRDFTLFLRSRSEEMIPGGHMVLVILGSDKNAYSSDSRSYSIIELLSITLNSMAQEGLIEEEKLNSFNLPYYAPIEEEVRHVIQTEGSFKIKRFETFKVDWNANMIHENDNRSKNVGMSIRAVTESILASSFGEEIMDNLFDKFSIKIEEYLQVEKGEYTNIVISMKKG